MAEPKQDNSGIPQGIFVRRHRVPRDDGSGTAIAPADLAVGATVTVYGRTFFLVGHHSVTAGNACQTCSTRPTFPQAVVARLPRYDACVY